MKVSIPIVLSACFVLSACDKQQKVETSEQSPKSEESLVQAEEIKTEAAKAEEKVPVSLGIEEALDIQEAATKARYGWRHPKETLELFDIKAGQTVLEVLPGGGWYSKILLPVLGEEGTLIGVDYPIEIWPNFPFADGEFMDKRSKWTEEWPLEVQAWDVPHKGTIEAYTFSSIPEELNGSVDRVLYIRAMHNLSRYENKGQFLTQAMAETVRVLKPGGLVGVVQHAVSEETSDEWADGSRGYLKASNVKKLFQEAGFELIAESDINTNPADKPGEKDIVWRLPPTYYTSKDNDELKAQYEAIGESNRITLVFKKPEIIKDSEN